MRRLLNFGCGSVTHPEWVNLDGAPAAPGVVRHDLRRPFPFPPASFEAAYGSHVLEHLEPTEGQRLLQDCLRILKPGGILRLAVPDLEAIARLYLLSLKEALAGQPGAEKRYDWMLLELYDQAVRTTPRGRMGDCLDAPLDAEQAAFIASRIGSEAKVAPGSAKGSRPVGRLLRRARERAAGLAAGLFLGADGRQAVRDGLFRRSGTPHVWMYDRFSLARELAKAGFANARVCSADESDIAEFARFKLETIDGKPRKPDSLFMEARRPG